MRKASKSRLHLAGVALTAAVVTITILLVGDSQQSPDARSSGTSLDLPTAQQIALWLRANGEPQAAKRVLEASQTTSLTADDEVNAFWWFFYITTTRTGYWIWTPGPRIPSVLYNPITLRLSLLSDFKRVRELEEEMGMKDKEVSASP